MTELKSVNTEIKRKGPSQSEMLKEMLGGSKKTLDKHKESALAIADTLNTGYKARKVGQESVNVARKEYNKAVDAISTISTSATGLTSARNDMEKSAIATRALKRKMTNIVKKFTTDAAHTGVEIADLQQRIGGYIKNNTADILEVIQKEREVSFNNLASVKLTKGLKSSFEVLGIPLNRATTSVSAIISGLLGYQLGKRL